MGREKLFMRVIKARRKVNGWKRGTRKALLRQRFLSCEEQAPLVRRVLPLRRVGWWVYFVLQKAHWCGWGQGKKGEDRIKSRRWLGI